MMGRGRPLSGVDGSAREYTGHLRSSCYCGVSSAAGRTNRTMGDSDSKRHVSKGGACLMISASVAPVSAGLSFNCGRETSNSTRSTVASSHATPMHTSSVDVKPSAPCETNQVRGRPFTEARSRRDHRSGPSSAPGRAAASRIEPSDCFVNTRPFCTERLHHSAMSIAELAREAVADTLRWSSNVMSSSSIAPLTPSTWLRVRRGGRICNARRSSTTVTLINSTRTTTCGCRAPTLNPLVCESDAPPLIAHPRFNMTISEHNSAVTCHRGIARVRCGNCSLCNVMPIGSSHLIIVGRPRGHTQC